MTLRGGLLSWCLLALSASAACQFGFEEISAIALADGGLHGCFQQDSANPDAQASISIRFQVDAAGTVQRAQVVPSSVAATPLGACLLALARNTAFGPQPEGLSFAIPISARVVRR